MALLSLANRTLYSASVQRNWTQTAYNAYNLANARRAIFNGLAQDYGDYPTVSYYLYYTGETNTIHYISTGSIDFVINGVTYSVGTGDNTFTVSGLTPHTVYTVTVTRSSSTTKLLWLAFLPASTNTTFPIFTDGTIPTRANFDDAFQSLSEVQAAADILSPTHPLSWLNTLNGDWRDAWRGGFIAGHDTLIIKYQVTGTGSLDFEVFVAGVSVAYHGRSGGGERTETIDLTGLGLTPGQIIEFQIRAMGTGGDSQFHTLNLYTYTTPAVPLSPDPEITAGDVVSQSQLRRIKNAVDYAHPANGSVPLPLEFPALRIVSQTDDSWTLTDFYYIRHRNRYLRYRTYTTTGTGTPQLIYSGDTVDLTNTGNDEILDLETIGDLVIGEYYQVTNCKFAFEDFTDA